MVNTDTPETHDAIAASDFMNEFEALLDEYNYASPYRGQILNGVIIRADDHEIMLDVGLKRDAFVPRTDIDRLDSDVLDTLVPGTSVKAYVMQPNNNDGDLIVSINKGLELEDWETAQTQFDDTDIVSVTIVGTNRGGLLARYKRLTGFIPMSQLVSISRFTSDDEMNEAKVHLINRKLEVKIIEVDRVRNRLIFSERAAQMQIQRVRMNQLDVGMDVEGRVVGLVDFGAFVDIGGVDGLVHISKLDHRFVDHPGEVLAIGDVVQVRIESIDEKNDRISLNRKVLLPDPWETLEKNYKEGDILTVSVTNIVDFGAFVSMPNGLQALVHVSNMQSLDTQNLRNVLREGDELLAKIISIDVGRQRIGLSLDNVSAEQQEAWMYDRHEDVPPASDFIDTDEEPVEENAEESAEEITEAAE